MKETLSTLKLFWHYVNPIYRGKFISFQAIKKSFLLWKNLLRKSIYCDIARYYQKKENYEKMIYFDKKMFSVD